MNLLHAFALELDSDLWILEPKYTSLTLAVVGSSLFNTGFGLSTPYPVNETRICSRNTCYPSFGTPPSRKRRPDVGSLWALGSRSVSCLNFLSTIPSCGFHTPNRRDAPYSTQALCNILRIEWPQPALIQHTQMWDLCHKSISTVIFGGRLWFATLANIAQDILA